jgi:glycosyltransferase involved in cell wall biosynthesis
MKVFFLTYHFPTPHEAGAGRPWETARLLRQLGHEPIVITAGTHYMTGEDIRQNRHGLWSSEEVDGFRVIKTFATGRYRNSLARRILNYTSYAVTAFLAALRQGKPDIVLMATDPMFIVPVGLMLAKLRRARLILDERDLFPDALVALGYLAPGNVMSMLEAWQNYVRQRAFSILAATPGIRQLLLEKGIKAEKIFVLPNRRFSVTELNGHHDIDVIRRHHAWDDKFVVLYTGKFGQGNDLLTIIRAAGKLLPSFPQIRFVFIGDGERKQECLEYCRQNKLCNVELMPPQPWDKLQAYLAAADAGVQAFRKDPFWDCYLSTKIFDYMLATKPILFAGRGDSPDLINRAGAGMVVAPEAFDELAQAIVYLHQHRSLCREMGERGRTYAMTQFTAAQAADTLTRALQGA